MTGLGQRITASEQVRFDERGLVPAVVQHAAGGQVLMLAYMDAEALRRTLASGETWFWSRSRSLYWHKGETSGNTQRVVGIWADCDGDALLVQVEAQGPACHTGQPSCFHNPLTDAAAVAAVAGPATEGQTAAPPDLGAVLTELEVVLADRRANPREGSYTSRLLQGGPDPVCKKVGEEATEVVLAAKNEDLENLIWEVADLWFHTLVLLQRFGLGSADVAAELARRRQTKK